MSPRYVIANGVLVGVQVALLAMSPNPIILACLAVTFVLFVLTFADWRRAR